MKIRTLLAATTIAAFAASSAKATLVSYFPADGAAGTFANTLDDIIDDGSHPVVDGVSNVDDVATYVNDPTRGDVVNSPGDHRWLAGTQGIDLTKGFTWSLWVKVALGETGSHVVIGTRNGAWHKITSSSGVDGTGFVDFASGAYDLSDDTWHHIGYVGTDNGSGDQNNVDVSLYLDGVKIGTDTTAATLLYDGQMEIGGTTRFGEFADTLMDDIAIWDEALTEQQIIDLFNGADPQNLGGGGFDPADLDQDGDVDDADFGIAFAAFTGPGNGPSSNPDADLDNDGDVDDADFGIAFAAFTGPGGAAVPEPASLALLGLGGLLIARRRRA